jgi:hypothetical protein
MSLYRSSINGELATIDPENSTAAHHYLLHALYTYNNFYCTISPYLQLSSILYYLPINYSYYFRAVFGYEVQTPVLKVIDTGGSYK